MVQENDGVTREILVPGRFFVEFEIGRACPASALEEGLAQMGWEPVAIDQSGTPKEPLRSVRFVGDLKRTIQAIDLPDLRWSVISTINVDVFADLQYGAVEPHALVHGRTYELRFTARMKSHPSQKAVTDELLKMGFQGTGADRTKIDLLSLKRDMRVPDRPGTSTSLWFAIAEWTGPDGFITVDDAFLFQDVYDRGMAATVVTFEEAPVSEPRYDVSGDVDPSAPEVVHDVSAVGPALKATP